MASFASVKCGALYCVLLVEISVCYMWLFNLRGHYVVNRFLFLSSLLSWFCLLAWLYCQLSNFSFCFWDSEIQFVFISFSEFIEELKSFLFVCPCMSSIAVHLSFASWAVELWNCLWDTYADRNICETWPCVTVVFELCWSTSAEWNIFHIYSLSLRFCMLF